MKRLLNFLFLLKIATISLADIQPKDTSIKTGFYIYQNLGLMGGVGVSAYPFKKLPSFGVTIGGFYYGGGLLSRINKVNENYTGLEVGLDILKKVNGRKNSSKENYRGLNISAFYATSGDTKRTDWWELTDCRHLAGPAVTKVENTSFAYGVKFGYRFSKSYDNDKLLSIFSILPEARIIKSSTEYLVSCNNVDFSKETVSGNVFPLTVRVQWDFMFKVN